ncbi:response regulator transcription factor [Methylocella sp.]|uniref:response regulator transcription factor n=1 Tax=Methylocella sp. TaxID=1978226 RepID=UPI003784C1AD
MSGLPQPLADDEASLESEALEVVVVDDDEAVRSSLEELFISVGLRVRSYGSSQAFLTAGIPQGPSCLVLDVRLPEESGLKLQERLNEHGVQLPVIFITAHADVPMSVRAMKHGAANFLPKPFRDQELLDAVWEALHAEAARHRRRHVEDGLKRLAQTLTPREIQILRAVDRGLLNKQIAHELGIAEITVKMHRSNAFRKLKAKSVADMILKIRSLDLDGLAEPKGPARR